MSKTLVFGHQNPDTDTITSALVMADFLKAQGVEAEAVAFAEPSSETNYALEHFQIDAPRVVETVANETSRVALVDHNEPQQSAPDIQDVTVTHVIDHHRVSGFETTDPLYMRVEPVGCTGTILNKMFKEQGFEVTKESAGLMLSAIISDTLLFKSPTNTPEDEAAAKELAKIAGVDLKDYGLNLLRAGTNLGEKSDDDILNADAKNFDMHGKNVRIGQVNVIGFDEIQQREAAILQLMNDQLSENGYDLFALIITDVLESDSYSLVVGEDLSAFESAFAKKVTDHKVDLPGVVSRKKQIVPPLTNAYE